MQIKLKYLDFKEEFALLEGKNKKIVGVIDCLQGLHSLSNQYKIKKFAIGKARLPSQVSHGSPFPPPGAFSDFQTFSVKAQMPPGSQFQDALLSIHFILNNL